MEMWLEVSFEKEATPGFKAQHTSTNSIGDVDSQFPAAFARCMDAKQRLCTASAEDASS